MTEAGLYQMENYEEIIVNITRLAEFQVYHERMSPILRTYQIIQVDTVLAVALTMGELKSEIYIGLASPTITVISVLCFGTESTSLAGLSPSEGK